MQILDGRVASQAIKDNLKTKISQLQPDNKKPPHLAAVLVGNNAASETYVGSKVKNCKEVGITSTLVRLDEAVSETELLENVQALNDNDDIDGILVQLPLPGHISEQKVINAISPAKDVDGFHPVNAVSYTHLTLPTT